MNNFLEILDPTAILIIGGILLKMVSPLIKSIHLSKKQTTILNEAKKAVVYAATQAGLDNDEKRKLAEQQLASWATSHGVHLTMSTIETTVEYAYQYVKNNNTIQTVPDKKAVTDSSDSFNFPTMDPKILDEIKQRKDDK